MSKDNWIKIIYTAIGILAAWLFVRYVLGWLAPFILALLTARLMESSVKALISRIGVKRGIAASICSMLAIIALGAIIILVVTRIAAYVGDFITNLPDLLGDTGNFLTRINLLIKDSLGAAPLETQKITNSMLDSFTAMIEGIPKNISTWTISAASGIATSLPKFIMFFFTYLISVFFISVSYPSIIKFIMRQIPPRWHSRVLTIKEDFFLAMVKWLKAQLTLMVITFIELAVSFSILGIPYGILLALAVALIDALPVFGTGTVLIPWALISLIGGESVLAIGLIVTYGIVSLARSIIEPRLVGGQFGISPVATLMAMYIGYCTFGVFGMIFFPFGIMLLKQLNDKSYIRLWK